MLSELKIENVAVIEKAQVHFDQGFNVLTGETGAGKSILIDSIQAIMGSRVVTWFGPVRVRRAFGQPLSKFRNG